MNSSYVAITFPIATGLHRPEKHLSATIFTTTYWPGENDFVHLEFALKREGLHLQLLRELLPKLSAQDLSEFVNSKPTGANARRIWLLYEKFTETKVETLPNAVQGNYVDLLNPKLYYTGKSIHSPRHRVNTNLLGHSKVTKYS